MLSVSVAESDGPDGFEVSDVSGVPDWAAEAVGDTLFELAKPLTVAEAPTVTLLEAEADREAAILVAEGSSRSTVAEATMSNEKKDSDSVTSGAEAVGDEVKDKMSVADAVAADTSGAEDLLVDCDVKDKISVADADIAGSVGVLLGNCEVRDKISSADADSADTVVPAEVVPAGWDVVGFAVCMVTAALALEVEEYRTYETVSASTTS